MATIETRTIGKPPHPVYWVRWRLGGTRDGHPEGERFTDLKLAEKFRTDVEYHDHQWPPNYVPKHGYVTEAEMAALTALVEQADRPSKPFLPFAADFIDHLTGIEAKTRGDYHRFVQNHMASFPAFADADLTDPESLTAREVAEWVNWLEAGVPDPDDEEGLRWLRAPKSPKTIANLHGLLYMIMQSATVGEKPLRKYNPCVGTRLPSVDDSVDEEMVFLTPEEFAILHAAADPTIRDVLVAFVGTGMRFSELTAQKVGDYRDASAAQQGKATATRVHRAWKRQADNRFVEGAPKTKAGRRTIVVDEIVDAVFSTRCADRDRDAYTFTTRSGAIIRHNNFFGRYWQPAVYRAVRCEKHRQADRELGILVDGELVRLTNLKNLRQRHLRPCGCPGTLTKVPRIHDLRHTHVSWQIAGNVPLSAIARRVGHESVNTTDKTYGHLLPELDARQALAVFAALSAVGFRAGRLGAGAREVDDVVRRPVAGLPAGKLVDVVELGQRGADQPYDLGDRAELAEQQREQVQVDAAQVDQAGRRADVGRGGQCPADAGDGAAATPHPAAAGQLDRAAWFVGAGERSQSAAYVHGVGDVHDVGSQQPADRGGPADGDQPECDGEPEVRIDAPRGFDLGQGEYGEAEV